MRVIGATVATPGRGKGRHALKKHQKVVAFIRRESQRLENFLAVGVKPLFVELGVMADHVAQGGEAAIVHVGRIEHGVAQRRHLELAEIALLGFDMAGAGGGAARRVVAPARQQVVRAGVDLLDATMAAGIDTARLNEIRNTGVGELIVGEIGTEMTGVAGAFANIAPPPAGRPAPAHPETGQTGCAR